MDGEEEIASACPGNNVAETPAHKSRKRKRRPETWKRNVAKKARHRPKGFPVMPSCGHGMKGSFQCHQLSMQDVRRIHQKYYANPDLESNKSYILQHVTVSSAKRSVPEGQSRRQVSTCYTLPRQRQGIIKHVKVCRKAFLSVLNESRDRVQRLCQKYLHLGVTPPETRGGAHQVEKNELKRTAVKDFIKIFQPIQSHYCRGKNSVRQYFSSQLNVKKMWEMYLQKHTEENLRVEYEFFRTVFNENFNISFDAPYTDKCSTCLSLENKINDERDQAAKHTLQIELLAPKKRADTFYQHLREKTDGELVLTYDCQKNLVLPKLPDQAAYYKRQMYLFNFTICEGVSTTSQNTTNTYFYVWTEDTYAKGSNEIASALHHRLNNLDLDEVTRIRLFSDGCGGQNKNLSMIGMLSHWMLLEAPQHLKDIILLFPVVGHFSLPPDRVFGNLERQFRHESVIENPEKYIQVFHKFGKVNNLGEDCAVKDWKLYSQEILKPTGRWHFQFQKTKKLVLTRSHSRKSILVQGEPFYNFESGEPKTICKKGKTFRDSQIPDVVRGVQLKDAKIHDVRTLLSLHFGEKWEENAKLTFYTLVFQQQTTCNVPATARNEADEDEMNDFELIYDDGTEIS